MSLHGAADTFAVIMAGGRGVRLSPLTDHCTKPALPFGGGYRTVDFVLSNCLNSGLHRVSVLTQYHACPLIRYLSRNWQPLFVGPDRALEVWPAEQRPDPEWYSGTANAVFQNLDLIREYRPERVLILAADHVYSMDYRSIISEHIGRGAQVTVGCVEVPASECSHFGIMLTEDDGCIRRFVEKPKNPMGLTTSTGEVLASMGIYLFETDALLDALVSDADHSGSSHYFGGDIIPRLIRPGTPRVHAHRFRNPITGSDAYWRDIGTLDLLARSYGNVATLSTARAA